MKFIQLTRETGENLYVNVNHITKFTSTEDGKGAIVSGLSTHNIIVNESCVEIIKIKLQKQMLLIIP